METTTTLTTAPTTTPKIPCCPPKIKYIYPPPVENTTKRPDPLPPIVKITIPSLNNLTDPKSIITTPPPTTPIPITTTSTTTRTTLTTVLCNVNNCKKLNY